MSADEIEPTELDPDAHVSDLQFGEPYAARVDNIQDYGVFVNLTPPSGSGISGLVHQNELLPMTSVRDYEPGDNMVVELVDRKEDGDLAFRSLAAPDVDMSEQRSPSGKPEHAVDIEAVIDRIRESGGGGAAERIVDEALAGGGPVPVLSDSYDHAIRVLAWLRDEGYEVEHNAIENDDGTVHIQLSAVPSPTATSASVEATRDAGSDEVEDD